MIASVLLSTAIILLILASYIDVTELRIPNWLVLSVAGLFVPAAIAAGMPLREIALHLAAGASILTVGFVLFTIGLRFGGGDAKLFGAVVLWIGFAGMLPLFVRMCFIGGAVAAVVYMLRQFGIPIWLAAHGWNVPALEVDRKKPFIPYAPAIALSFISLVVR